MSKRNLSTCKQNSDAERTTHTLLSARTPRFHLWNIAKHAIGGKRRTQLNHLLYLDLFLNTMRKVSTIEVCG